MVCLDVADDAFRRLAQESVTASPEQAHWAAAILPTCAPPCGGPVLRNTHTPREADPTNDRHLKPASVTHTLKSDALRADGTTFVRNLSWV
jgi:hypothetical protein